MRSGYVYIISNRICTVLYIGVTNNLVRRIQEHRDNKTVTSFSYRYNINRLLYFEYYERISDAIVREKQLKKWKRSWKLKLIIELNPAFEDLFKNLL